eukprot:3953882-Pleurochrysis_carterae.AAC.1
MSACISGRRASTCRGSSTPCAQHTASVGGGGQALRNEDAARAFAACSSVGWWACRVRRVR